SKAATTLPASPSLKSATSTPIASREYPREDERLPLLPATPGHFVKDSITGANRQSRFQRIRKADAGLEIIFNDRRCESPPAGFARPESRKDQSPRTAPAAGVWNVGVHNGISVALVMKRREKFVPEP